MQRQSVAGKSVVVIKYTEEQETRVNTVKNQNNNNNVRKVFAHNVGKVRTVLLANLQT